jgi:hypothetical protein
LQLNADEAYVFGVIYFVAMFLGHGDVVNNIDGSNSGKVTNKVGATLAAIVDWGNCLGVGFNGCIIESAAFHNPEFNELPNLTTADADPITGYTHCMPFDEIVTLQLPRQVIKNLFHISSESKESDIVNEKMFAGFKDAYEIAQKKFAKENIIQPIINDTFEHYVNQDDRLYYESIVNKDFFFSNQNDSKTYNLSNILKARLKSLHGIIEKLNKGFTFEEVAKGQIEDVIYSQKRFKK